MFAISVPVVILEGTSVVDAMKRSKELTTGYKSTIFGIFFVLGLINFAIGFVLGLVFMAGGPDLGKIKAMMIIITLVSIVLNTWQGVATVIMYYTLRNIKEQVSLEDLAKAFE